jgi:hypothetical protein
MPLWKNRIIAGAAAGAVLVTGLVTAAPADAQTYVYRHARPAPVYVYKHRSDPGAAVAAGVVGGLALGALAATAARPAYGAPYLAPVQDVYEEERIYSPRRCYNVSRKVVDEFGDVTITRRRVCD